MNKKGEETMEFQADVQQQLFSSPSYCLLRMWYGHWLGEGE